MSSSNGVPVVLLNHGSVVLVTGGTGLFGYGLQKAVEKHFGGSAITEAMSGEGKGTLITESEEARRRPTFVWMSSKTANLKDYESIKSVFEKYKPTHVVHFAARVGGLFANMADNIGFFRDNMEMNDNVLKLCHEFNVGRAIFCLSTCVFPAEAKLPLSEKDLHSGPPHFSNEGYAMAKRMLEMLVRFYRQTYNHDWLCIIPTNLYGPNDNFNLNDSHVIPGLLHKCYIAQKSGEPFVVSGSGKPLRQFLYSMDAGEIVYRLLSKTKRFEGNSSLILCGDNDSTGECAIADVANSIVKAMNFKGEMRFDTSRADGIDRKTASNANLRQFLGPEFQFTPLSQGIAESVKWFVDNYDTSVRK